MKRKPIKNKGLVVSSIKKVKKKRNIKRFHTTSKFDPESDYMV